MNSLCQVRLPLHRLSSLLALASLLSAGCGQQAGPADCDSELSCQNELTVGTGTWRFEPLTDGDTVELVRGSQGGWHVWLAVQGRPVEDGDRLVLEAQIADESLVVSRAELTPAFDPPNQEGYRSFLGWPAIVNQPECLVGELLRVQATLVRNGVEYSDERFVRVLPGADPPGACQ